MKILIEIDDNLYKDVKKYTNRYRSLGEAVANGKPLPKGHGRLIDADTLVDGFDRSSICDMAVADHLSVLEPVFLLENRHQLTNGIKLSEGDRLVVITDHFYPDRMVIALFATAPHRPSGMERLTIPVYNAVNNPFLINAVVGLTSFRQFVQRTAGTGLCSMQHDKPGRLPYGTLRVSRTSVAVGKRQRPCTQGRQQRHPHRQRFQDA